MFDPAQEDPTVPYGYRPLAGPGGTGASPSPYATPSATPPTLPRMPVMSRPPGMPGGQENPFDDVLERVERDWTSAIDQEGPQDTRVPQEPAAPRTPFADHMLDGQATSRWRPLAGEVGSRLGVPTPVALALVQTVSQGQPDYAAAGGQAVGLAGVPRALAPGIDLTDPTANLTTALARLRSAHDRLGDWDKAALAATGFGDDRGQPRILGQGVDGFSWLSKFKAARSRYESEPEEG